MNRPFEPLSPTMIAVALLSLSFLKMHVLYVLAMDVFLMLLIALECN
jgi:hypothetical protein